MTAGFGGDAKQGRLGKDLNITVNLDSIPDILREYKKIKKYQKSSLYAIRKIDGTEKVISSLIQEALEDPL